MKWLSKESRNDMISQSAPRVALPATRIQLLGGSMPITDTLNRIARSKTDRKVFGICGGLAHATSTPPWIWRAGFVMSIFFGGLGVIAYVVLWIFMPSPKKDIQSAAPVERPAL
ncbi:MAG: PspC domain-containing protein [Tepidisphaeraceae bacterium]